MGACGCGNFNGWWRIPGPDGKWYVIGPYSGCNNGCDTPIGLSFDLMDENELRQWDAQKLPVIGGPDDPTFGIPIVHPTELAKRIFDRLDKIGVNCGEDEYDREETVSEFDTLDVLAMAMSKAVDEFDKSVRTRCAKKKKGGEALKERPILFSGEMVRAILDGRKTQTRRIVKPHHIPAAARTLRWENQDAEELMHVARCPHGVPGDRLWVRETWRQDNPENGYVYRATNPGHRTVLAWRPPNDMPRCASRLLLEIGSVRVERLQAIGNDGRRARDVLAEGVNKYAIEAQRKWFHTDDAPAMAFSMLWERINGRGSWAANPWVWVIEFKVVQ